MTCGAAVARGDRARCSNEGAAGPRLLGAMPGPRTSVFGANWARGGGGAPVGRGRPLSSTTERPVATGAGGGMLVLEVDGAAEREVDVGGASIGPAMGRAIAAPNMTVQALHPPPAEDGAWAVPDAEEGAGLELAAWPEAASAVDTPPFFRRFFDAVEDSAGAVDPAQVCLVQDDCAADGPAEAPDWPCDLCGLTHSGLPGTRRKVVESRGRRGERLATEGDPGM